MQTQKYLIANGNTTIIVWDSDDLDRATLNSLFLAQVEQVGYVSTKAGLPAFEMMGGELSINGTLAFASTFGMRGAFYTSGVNSAVEFVNIDDLTIITLPLRYSIVQSTVLFEGIGYIYMNESPQDKRLFLKDLARTYGLPAFGLLLYKNDVLYPTIYVRETDSCVEESACGSGSVALSLLTNCTEVLQPSGGIITINKDTEAFTISAKVVQIQ